MPLTIASDAFKNMGPIPARFTCDGEDLSPPLSWADVPTEARSLALIVEDLDAPDPDAPRMTWVHWIAYNIPPTVLRLPEGAGTNNLPRGALEGANDWHRTGYGGPCPPIGRHRYFFKLYALNTVLTDLRRPSKTRLEAAIKGHVIAQAEIVGTYQKKH